MGKDMEGSSIISKRWQRHLRRVERDQKEINGSGRTLDYTGEKCQVRGPGRGIEWIKDMVRLKYKNR
jgi:hypothetical protein